MQGISEQEIRNRHGKLPAGKQACAFDSHDFTRIDEFEESIKYKCRKCGLEAIRLARSCEFDTAFFGSYIDNFDVHSQRQAEMANKKTVLIKKDGAISAVPPLFMHGLRRPSLDMRKIISPHGNGWQPSQSTHRFCGFGVMLRNVFTVQRMHLSAERLLSVLRLFCAGYWFPSSLYPILFL